MRAGAKPAICFSHRFGGDAPYEKNFIAFFKIFYKRISLLQERFKYFQ